MAARPKLTPAVQKAFCAEVRRGLPRRRAAAIVGIDEGTASRWYRDGGGEGAPKRLREFRAAVDKAEAELQSAWLTKAQRGAGARGFLNLMIRRFASEWGRRDNVEEDDPVELAANAAAARQELAERLEKMLRVMQPATPAAPVAAPTPDPATSTPAGDPLGPAGAI